MHIEPKIPNTLTRPEGNFHVTYCCMILWRVAVRLNLYFMEVCEILIYPATRDCFFRLCKGR